MKLKYEEEGLFITKQAVKTLNRKFQANGQQRSNKSLRNFQSRENESPREACYQGDEIIMMQHDDTQEVKRKGVGEQLNKLFVSLASTNSVFQVSLCGLQPKTTICLSSSIALSLPCPHKWFKKMLATRSGQEF